MPVITTVEDMASQEAIKAIEGGTGVYEEVLNDDTLVTLAAAEAAGLGYLRDHANPQVTGSFVSLNPGWQPGQLLTINLPQDGLQNEYIIEATEAKLVDGQWEWTVHLGGRLIGIPDILRALVSAQQAKRTPPAKGIQKYVYGEDTLAVADELVTGTRALPYVCGDADAICGLTVVSDGTVVITDSFNRANSATSLGNADTGDPWNVLGGTWGINSNQAYVATDSGGRNMAVIDAGVADGVVEISIPTMTQYAGLVFRVVDTNNYFRLTAHTATTYVLRRTVNNAQVDLGTYNISPANGHTLKVVFDGSTITPYINGAAQTPITDANFVTATKHGIFVFNSTVPRFDNFSYQG
jgi:hypothetical protein